jgi:predicted flap endonuclease-1-like 5' DNA nuclease
MCKMIHILAVCTVLFWQGSASASTYPLENILPKDPAEKLAKIGIKTSEELLEKGALPALRKKIAKDTGLDQKQITEWVHMCDLLRIKGVGPVMTKLLAAVKVTSVAELKKRKANALYEAVMKANEKVKVTENPPSEKHLEHWIEQAKALKIMVK